MRVELQPQECRGNYKFNGQLVYTKGVETVFKDHVFELILGLMASIHELVEKNTADYFQVATVEFQGSEYKLYIIDDISYITILLSSEY